MKNQDEITATNKHNERLQRPSREATRAGRLLLLLAKDDFTGCRTPMQVPV